MPSLSELVVACELVAVSLWLASELVVAQVEAETQGELIDTAILLASDDQMVADPMDGEEVPFNCWCWSCLFGSLVLMTMTKLLLSAADSLSSVANSCPLH